MWIGESEDLQLAEMMARSQSGDAVVYQQLLSTVSQILSGFLRARLHGVPAADDVLQETLISVHRARHTFDPSRSFASWLFGICEHRIGDYLRTAERAKRYVALDPRTLEELAIGNPRSTRAEARESVAKAIGQLPRSQRRAIELLKLEGMSVAEASERLGVSATALKVAAHRGYLALRRIMGAYSNAD